jgi:plasmid stabilization system protein ParE
VSLSIYYTPRAEETLRSTYHFINANFGALIADKFVLRAEKIIALIAENPFMYKATIIDTTVRIALISKQTSLFYRIQADSIHLLFFWDNRQEPFLQ